MEDPKDITRDKATRLFTYLKELSQMKTKVTHDLSEYEQVIWLHDIPKEKECFCITWGGHEERNDLWLEIKRPKRLSPPDLPNLLRDWLPLAQLKDSSTEPKIQEQLIRLVKDPGTGAETSTIIRLEENPQIKEGWQDYLTTQWRPWAEADKKTAAVENVYKDLFSFYQKQQKLGEAFEVVLGLGLLQWKKESGRSIKRHLLTTKTSISFDPKRAIISVGPISEGTKLIVEQDMVEPNERPSAEFSKSLDQQAAEVGEELWDRVRVQTILQSWINSASSSGQYSESQEPAKAVTVPTVSFAPALILRKQNERNLIRMYQEIISQLEGGVELPIGIARLVEIMDDKDPSGERGHDNSEPNEIYFPLPANKEQRAIAERLETHQGVLVQGPPGTGKSHTIANLICHLLASGQRILVTSHTSRALKVLRNKFPADLSPLCVSLLGEDQSGLKALEDSVQGITDRYNHWNSFDNEEAIARYKKQLQSTREEIAKTKVSLRELREVETYNHSNKFGTYSGTLARISQTLAKETQKYDWFIDEVTGDSDCPLTENEAIELADKLEVLSKEQEGVVKLSFPPLTAVLPPQKFEQLITAEKDKKVVHLEFGSAQSNSYYQLLVKLPSDIRKALYTNLRSVRLILEDIRVHRYPWVQKAVEQILSDRDRIWNELRTETQNLFDSIDKLPKEAWDYEVTGLDGKDLNEITVYAEELKTHFSNGGGMGFAFFKPKAIKQGNHLLTNVRVNGRLCETKETLGNLLAWLSLRKLTAQLLKLWLEVGEKPTGTGRFILAEIRDFCEPIEKSQKALEYVRATRPVLLAAHISEPNWYDAGQLLSYENAVRAAEHHADLALTTNAFAQLIHHLEREIDPEKRHPIVISIKQAIEERDLPKYKALHKELEGLHQLCSAIVRRNLLSDKIRECKKLFFTLSDHDAKFTLTKRLPDLPAAWRWSQAKNWIKKITDPKAQENLNSVLNSLMKNERALLSKLASEKAWRFCFSRMTEAQRQHLMAWSKAMKKIGKGTGKHANKHRQDARESMQGCRDAIPAWIMPLHKIAESVNPGKEVFDVAIIDEASQSGPEALFLHYLARKIIVVGDDKQISPESWIERDSVQLLRDKWIPDVPHQSNIGVDDSFFDLAQIRFSGRIRLREHFRCMPEIIQFSNNLCYQSEPLIPLKQFGASRLTPVLKRTHLPNGYQQGSSGKVCNPPEADSIVAAISEIVKNPTYTGKTIGVISLLGEMQAKIIEKKLMEAIGPEEMETRELVCGDAYAFQGDERDIIMLSLVSAPSDGHSIGILTKAADERRFNVAASRAKEQMWLFHSANLNDLNPKCLRYRLLEYFQNPSIQRTEIDGVDINSIRMLAKDADRAIICPPAPFDSWFEVDVFFKIHDRGFRVVPQYEIAGRRIDMIVESLKGRLAVECDGDHWHGPQHFEQDLARQLDLERCGFRFWRVRESIFYLDRDKAMESLWNRLAELEVAATPVTPPKPVATPNVVAPVVQIRSSVSQPAMAPVAEDTFDTIGETNSDSDPAPAHKSMSIGDMAQLLIEIIKSEGPMPAHRAFRLYAKRMGMQRLGKQLTVDLKKAMTKALKSDQLLQEDELHTRDSIYRILRTPEMPRAIVRPRGDRTFEEIPPSEFAEAIRRLTDQSPGVCNQADIYRTVLKQYEFGRLTDSAKNVLDIAWQMVFGSLDETIHHVAGK